MTVTQVTTKPRWRPRRAGLLLAALLTVSAAWPSLTDLLQPSLGVVEARPGPARDATARGPSAGQAAGQAAAVQPDRQPPLSIDLGALQPRWRSPDAAQDAFAARHWHPPVAASPIPVQEPRAPPPAEPPALSLPFSYVGMLEEPPGRTVWYLSLQDRLIIAAQGDVIDGIWRVEGMKPGQLHMRHLPSKQAFSLAIGETP